jgi:prepilin-type N-terminal cleavage/methylation domain-containing protein
MDKRRGFSMVELSIALGIIGVVVSGIWVVASNTQQNMMASRLEQQTMILVKNVRDYYATRTLPAAQIVAATLTSTLRTASVFPEEMCPANCVSGGVTTVYNAYGGTATVAIPNETAPINHMEIAYADVTEKGCIETAMRLSARSSELGLYSYKVGAAAAITSFPISLATADSNCAASNTLTITFNIRN